MITKDLGLVTAYAYAVAGGYTGTEAEFTELLGNIATDLEEIENLTVTVDTLPPGSEATASYSDGVLHLGIPRGDKGDKGDTGETGPQGPKGDPGDVSTEQLDEAISGVRAEMEENYARNDGYYEEMTVGDAEQLISTQFVEDSDPYLFRPTGGSADVGNREYLDEIVGGTVGWNQLVPTLDTFRTEGGVTMTYADGVATISSTTARNGIYAPLSYRKGNKYLFRCDLKATSEYSVILGATSAAFVSKAVTGDNQWHTIVGIGNSSASFNANAYIFATTTYENLQVRNYNIIDLTALFNPTIADYIYSLEQSQAGAGVAWFRRYFSKSYYPYDPGTLRSVEGVSAHETVGKNLLDAKPYSGFSYNQASGTAVNLAESSIAITQSENGFSYEIASGWRMVNFKTAPLKAGTYHVQIGGTVSESRLSVYVVGTDGKTKGSAYNAVGALTVSTNKTLLDGEYILVASGRTTVGTQALITPQIELGSTATAYEPYTKHTYPLDSSLTLRGVPKLVDGKLAFDGDVYPPSGEVQRRYGLRAYQSGDESLTDAITDGTNTVYKLSTPTTETAEGYEHYQICDPSGTEQFVTDSIVPVGHDTRYPANLRDKLQHLPDLPSPLMDGTYMVMVNGSQMYLEKLLIPEAPTTDGTYTLKATVSGGTPTYTWEVEA